MNEFTPEQEKRINELIEQRERRAGLLGWLFGFLPSSAATLLLLALNFHEVDEYYHSLKDTVEDAPQVFTYAGQLAYNAFELAQHGQLPMPHDGDANLITIYSTGTNPINIPAGSSAGYYAYTKPVEIWVTGEDGTIKALPLS